MTLPVTLVCAPPLMATTLTEKVQELLARSVAAVRLTVLPFAGAVMTPPPQLPLSPLGVATLKPEGRVSRKCTPVRESAPLKLSIWKVREVEVPTSMRGAPKNLAMLGGFSEVSVALA